MFLVDFLKFLPGNGNKDIFKQIKKWWTFQKWTAKQSASLIDLTLLWLSRQ